MSLIIKGTGSALPENIVTNEEIAKLVDTSDEWIAERTGIKARHVAIGHTCKSLASLAASRALNKAGVKGEDVELIIVASCSSEKALPCIACEVQAEIDAKKAVAFDLNAACSGFLFALNTAETYLSAGIYKNALIIGTEVLSNMVDWNDRGTCILFGDGAGAMYVEAKPGLKNYFFVQRSDGYSGDVLSCLNRSSENFKYKGEETSKYIQMDGREVFKFATRQIPKAIEELMSFCGKSLEDVDLFILHQANLRIIETISKRLQVPFEKFPYNVDEVGNTSSASIPILFDKLICEEKIKAGMKLVLSGFGAGLTYGASYLEIDM